MNDALRQIVADLELATEHPAESHAEAEVLHADPGIDDPSLVDLTSLPFVTIDEEHSKDLDQALFVERADDGFVVWYAIADAAWFVRPGSSLFDEALHRGSSYYLPGLVLPLLPRALSEDLVSLNPDVDRRALVFRVSLDAGGAVQHTEIQRARVRSRVKTWYDAVQAWYDGTADCPGDETVAESLRVLAEVGRLRIALARSRDVVQYRRTELAVRLEGEGEDRGFVAMASPRNDVERYNEQISLLCNTEGARLLRDHPADHVQPIYRSHAPPREFALQELRERLDALAEGRGLDDSWRWVEGQTLADYLDSLPRDRLGAAIHRQALLAQKGAVFAATPDRHYGVGSDVYARFTAPMREVVGIWVHKETWEMLGLEAPGDNELDAMYREQVIAVSHECRKIQREIDREGNRLVLDALFEADQQAGTRRAGTVMGLSRGRVHVQLDAPPVDVKIYTPHLEGGDGMYLSRRDTELRRGDQVVVRVGDAVKVSVHGRDEERDRWVLRLHS